MFFKKLAATMVALLSVSVIAIALLSPTSLPKIDGFKDAFKEEPTNSLSGRVGSDGPILVVKIDDTPAAHPQVGLEDADLVYIEQVEGGLTRLRRSSHRRFLT